MEGSVHNERDFAIIVSQKLNCVVILTPSCDIFQLWNPINISINDTFRFLICCSIDTISGNYCEPYIQRNYISLKKKYREIICHFPI